jgi:haloalkane dehalogenase
VSPVPVLRTPEHRFADLPGFPHPPRYLDVTADGLRMAYVDVGPRDAETVYLCLHGEPTWSYLYRRMIPVLTAAGGRVVAPDLLGFGRSDKPVDDAVHTFDLHRDSLLALWRALDLTGVTLVVQDWGGLLGLTLPVEPDMARRTARLLVMNTALATGVPLGPGFDAWRSYAGSTEDLPVGALMRRAEPTLTAAEAAAYDAPFPDSTYKAGVRRLPQMVMTRPDMEGVEVSRRAAEFWACRWTGATFMAVGERDPVLAPVMPALRATIRGCPDPLVLPEAGHFVQEHGEVVARAALAHFAREG